MDEMLSALGFAYRMERVLKTALDAKAGKVEYLGEAWAPASGRLEILKENSGKPQLYFRALKP